MFGICALLDSYLPNVTHKTNDQTPLNNTQNVVLAFNIPRVYKEIKHSNRPGWRSITSANSPSVLSVIKIILANN